MYHLDLMKTQSLFATVVVALLLLPALDALLPPVDLDVLLLVLWVPPVDLDVLLPVLWVPPVDLEVLLLVLVVPPVDLDLDTLPPVDLDVEDLLVEVRRRLSWPRRLYAPTARWFIKRQREAMGGIDSKVIHCCNK